uniref:Uncharacterized protein LOC111114172 n=1 Tax=Crassostrea virginica TaxID=6565 RepID=A0A8B8BXQ4_CRAVI|nr:uncharacterized protein LOC111114172 [Crassostrea virginica]
MNLPNFLQTSAFSLWMFLLFLLPLETYSAGRTSLPNVRKSGDIQISTAGRRDLNLIPEIWKDQIKRRICEIIRIRCDGIYGPKKNDTTEEIVFTPIKPPISPKVTSKTRNLSLSNRHRCGPARQVRAF